jgi:hypothetical protein
MLAAIEFDNEVKFDTNKVGDIFANRILAAKLAPHHPVTQVLPQPGFRVVVGFP